jgi:glycosyltransferase involved in cell wall biosynthesis
MKICFWGEIAGTLNGEPLGGGEKQIGLLAKCLVRSGHEVVYVDYTVKNDYVTSDGIKVFGVKSYDKGIKIIRNVTSRLRLIYSSLIRQNADVYYCRIRDFRHILAYRAARKVKGKFVLGVASDLDVSSISFRLKYLYSTDRISLWGMVNGLISEVVYPFLLRKADLVLVQHRGQQNALLRKHIKSTIFCNLIELEEIPVIPENDRNYFVYVGALDRRKGFKEFFDLISMASRYKFRIIGEPRDKASLLLYNKLKSYNNVGLVGKLSHPDALKQIFGAKAMISTSPMEGFPNIFLEAWEGGVPVFSLYVDPGNVIEIEKLGIVAHGDLNRIVQALSDAGPDQDFLLRTKTYLERNHVLNDSKIREIEKIFTELVNENTENTRKNVNPAVISKD